MNDDIRRYLDDEISLDDLSGDARAEAEAWERLLAAFHSGQPASPPPPWLEERVMAEIRTMPEPGFVSRLLAWLVHPLSIRVPPLAAGIAAAAVVALALWPGRASDSPGEPGPAATVVYVQFELTAPTARSVAVGGDFDGWSGTNVLEDPDGDGVWTGRVAVQPGLHTYMFLVDGSDWVTDPEANRYTDDGFGNRNAVLAVAAPTT